MLQSVLDSPAAIAGGAAQRFVHPHEIVEHGVERDHVVVRLQLLAEPVSQPRKPAHPHPEIQVLAFHVGRADVLRIGTAYYAAAFGPFAIARAVAAEGANRFAVVLNQNGVIDISTERAFDRFQVGLMPVRRQLDPARQPGRDVHHEIVDVARIPSTTIIGLAENG